jgi:hypothetical protein
VLQVVDPLPEILPLAQASHVVFLAFEAENVFSEHSLHVMDSSASEYSPGIQGKHDACASSF